MSSPTMTRDPGWKKAPGQRSRFIHVRGLRCVHRAVRLVFDLCIHIFLFTSKLQNLAVSISTLGLVAAGVTLILLVGMLDVSTEAVLAMSSVALGFLMAKLGLPASVGVFGAIAVGAGIGIIDGLMHRCIVKSTP